MTFGLVVWALKAATLPAAVCGAMISLLLVFTTAGPSTDGSLNLPAIHSALSPLVVLFVLTFAATRAGRRHKEASRLAEARRGRSASQIVANLSGSALLGMLGLPSLMGWFDFLPHSGTQQSILYLTRILVLASLAEATADTVSSELGQAFGGTPFLITTFAKVPPGTDGAVTLLGTLAGILAAAAVTATGAWSLHLTLAQSAIALLGATTGQFFDSLLGATLERQGWLGNDLVNFTSTLFAPAIAFALLQSSL